MEAIVWTCAKSLKFKLLLINKIDSKKLKNSSSQVFFNYKFQYSNSYERSKRTPATANF
jgi:hypothetical protein